MNLPKGCKAIYRPKGRANEYSELALNLYRGCGHGCLYCFGPQVLRMNREQFHDARTRAPGLMTQLRKDARLCQEAGLRGRVLLCFTCDPYQPINARHELAREAIKILHDAGLNVQILTKGGMASMADIDLFTANDAYAATLTFADSEIGEYLSKQWEPLAAPPRERMAALRSFHIAGVPTWVSLEPVIKPEHSLEIIGQTYRYTNVYKAGTLNYHPHAKTIDWPVYAEAVVEALEQAGRPYYIKTDLAKHLGIDKGFWSGGPFCTCGMSDATIASEHDPLCLYREACRERETYQFNP